MINEVYMRPVNSVSYFGNLIKLHLMIYVKAWLF